MLDEVDSRTGWGNVKGQKLTGEGKGAEGGSGVGGAPGWDFRISYLFLLEQ